MSILSLYLVYWLGVIGDSMQHRSGQRLLFTAPRELIVETVGFPEPKENEVVVKTEMSAISGGTEMLVWRGQIPSGMEADSTIASLRKPFAYPCAYGYSLVGTVVEAGADSGKPLIGKKVFVFHPHESFFAAKIDELYVLPDWADVDDAVFLAQAETALSLVQDAAVLPGERVQIFGLGIIGLMCASLLKNMHLETLKLWDPSQARRDFAKKLGLEAGDPLQLLNGIKSPDSSKQGDADCALELSGNPRAFDQALHTLGFGGRLILGSWYGSKSATYDLGSWFHRSRITIMSSQVSTVSPSLSGRWTKARRIEASWEVLKTLRPSQWISHRFPLERAGDAYELVERGPEYCMQVLLVY